MTSNDRLDALFAAYREAVPDPEVSADFSPGLWRKIEAQRSRTTLLFQKFAQVCVVTTLIVAALIGTLLLPSSESREAYYPGGYIDVLSADFADDYSMILPVGDLQ